MGDYVFACVGRYIYRHYLYIYMCVCVCVCVRACVRACVCEQVPGANLSPIVTNLSQSYGTLGYR